MIRLQTLFLLGCLAILGCEAKPPRVLPVDENDNLNSLLLKIDEMVPGTRKVIEQSELAYYGSELEFQGGMDFATLIYVVPKDGPRLPHDKLVLSLPHRDQDRELLKVYEFFDKIDVGTSGTINLFQGDTGKYSMRMEEYLTSEDDFLYIQVTYIHNRASR